MRIDPYEVILGDFFDFLKSKLILPPPIYPSCTNRCELDEQTLFDRDIFKCWLNAWRNIPCSCFQYLLYPLGIGQVAFLVC